MLGAHPLTSWDLAAATRRVTSMGTARRSSAMQNTDFGPIFVAWASPRRTSYELGALPNSPFVLVRQQSRSLHPGWLLLRGEGSSETAIRRCQVGNEVIPSDLVNLF